MELTPDQYASLVGGGDSPLHYHANDRTPNNDTLKGLAGAYKSKTVTAGTTVLTGAEDYIIADTTSGNVLLTLPSAVKVFEIEILKPSSKNIVVFAPFDTDTILGLNASYSLSLGNAALRFKTFGTDWKII